jgi:hypothetical protein
MVTIQCEIYRLLKFFPNLHFIVAEYTCHDILSFTESWLKPNISTDSLKLPSYKPPYRRDRVDRLGVVVIVKDEINCVTRLDLHVGSVECIWLEIKMNNKKYLYGTFYIPPNSGQQIWEELEQSIDSGHMIASLVQQGWANLRV